MARRGNLRVTSTLVSGWLPKKEMALDKAVLEMATDIDRLAKTLAPKQTGALRKSGKIERLGTADYAVVFGGSRVPYAKRRHYENIANPQTLRYLERAGDSVSRGNIKKYLRNK